MSDFADFGINVTGLRGVEAKTTCPQCSPHRKKSKYPCLNVNLERGVWNCWHCGWTGSLKLGEYSKPTVARTKEYFKPSYKNTGLSEKALGFFTERGITEEVCQRNQVSVQQAYFPQLDDEARAIAFPYVSHGQVVNVKYRTSDKNFRQVGGAQKVLYKIDDIEELTIITEGEMDALSLEVAGFKNAISVPDGAPAVSTKNFDSKFEYLDDSRLDAVKTFVIAVDNDEPGRKLEEELSRRLGKERCRRVTWPEGCKDANEVLLRYGPEVLAKCIENANPYPVEGVYSISDISEDLDAIYSDGLPEGVSTGWPGLDDYYCPAPNQWTLVTGIPSMGKSEWLDALAVSLAENHGWVFGVCSPENQPINWHAAKLIEKRMGKRIKVASKEEFAEAKDWLAEHFHFILPDQPTIESVLDKAKLLVRRHGMKGLIIDPYNELDHTKRADGVSETEYVSMFLTYVRKFARESGVHVWLVAHPAKLMKERDGTYPVPDGYSVSGSAHFFNKADNIVAIHRDKRDINAPTEVHVQKIRSRWLGKLGTALMYWDSRSGRFTEEAKPRYSFAPAIFEGDTDEIVNA